MLHSAQMTQLAAGVDAHLLPSAGSPTAIGNNTIPIEAGA